MKIKLNIKALKETMKKYKGTDCTKEEVQNYYMECVRKYEKKKS